MWGQLNGAIPCFVNIRLYEKSCRTDEDAPFRYEGYVLGRYLVQGFADPDPLGFCRTGTMLIDHKGTTHIFKVEAQYVLVGHAGDKQTPGESNPLLMHWVLGHFTSSEKFEKTSVLRMGAEKDRSRLKKLNLAKRKIIDFVQ